MKKILISILLLLTLNVAAQTQEKPITVTENVAYRTDVGSSTQENEKLFIRGDLTGYDGFTIQHK